MFCPLSRILLPSLRPYLIYNSPRADGKLIGLEYMISENLFLTLSDEEKPLWYSNEYEVKSGVLFLLRVPEPIERHNLNTVCKTYGKTIHFSQVDKGDNLPPGLPQLMMALTRDGQLYDELAKDVEKRFRVSFEKRGRSESTGFIRRQMVVGKGLNLNSGRLIASLLIRFLGSSFEYHIHHKFQNPCCYRTFVNNNYYKLKKKL